MDGDESSMEGRTRGDRHFGVTAKMLRIVYMCASACEVVCARLRANVDDCVRG